MMTTQHINALEINKISLRFQEDMIKVKSLNDLLNVQSFYLGRKGVISTNYKNLRSITDLDSRKHYGKLLKQLSLDIDQEIAALKCDFAVKDIKPAPYFDIHIPPVGTPLGALHPITTIIESIKEFFLPLGFEVLEHTSEMETSFMNFDSLNIKEDHPSRSTTDTFYIANDILLRTQTSASQVQIMTHRTAPIKILVAGKAYRKDSDRTHTPMFHQVEGLVLNTRVTWLDLINTIRDFLHYLFSHDIKIRYRPSSFPFTEPSAEVDIMDENGDWMEILGCGMVHPKVLKNMNLCPKEHQGFAFGIGIERLVMIKYGIQDLRELYHNDIRLLRQFALLDF